MTAALKVSRPPFAAAVRADFGGRAPLSGAVAARGAGSTEPGVRDAGATGPTGAGENAPRLAFEVIDSRVAAPSATPQIAFRLRIDAGEGVVVRSIALNVQVWIVVQARDHDTATRRRLAEVLGAPEQWSRSPGSLLWTQATRIVPAFTGTTEIDLVVPCTYDFEVATAKVLHALRDGDVPLELLFGGTVFYPAGDGSLRTGLVPWDSEARYRMPADLWRRAMDVFFPSSAWLRVSRDVFDRLWEFRSERALPSWEAAIETLLAHAGGIRTGGNGAGTGGDGGGPGRGGERNEKEEQQ